jgi:hypothetical protein
LVIPCFWHQRIEAGDLASHVYNAWLAQLIAKGQAPGLYVAPQWTNVLFDICLYHAANWIGFAAAERLIVAACVLIFFWGALAFVAAVGERTPWELTPCLAMLAYGYAFSMGFMNYYLSAGLACIVLAVAWRISPGQRRWIWPLLAVLAVLVFVAHPIGFIWMLGIGAYAALWRVLSFRARLLLPLSAVAILAAVAWRVWRFPQYMADRAAVPFYFFNGADQLILYGHQYEYLAWACIAWGACCAAACVWRNRRSAPYWSRLRLPFEFYFVAICAAALLPEDLHVSFYAGWIGLLVSRLTLLTAILGLCLLASLCAASEESAKRSRRLALVTGIGFSICALMFFVNLYRDTRTLAGMEREARSIAETLPYGTRVIPTIYAPPDWRLEFIDHIVDRACAGHCFIYSNYEPSSGQFRVRAQPGSPVATASSDDAEDMQGGAYEVQPADLPLVQIYQCDACQFTRLCVRQYSAGELTGAFAHRPER